MCKNQQCHSIPIIDCRQKNNMSETSLRVNRPHARNVTPGGLKRPRQKIQIMIIVIELDIKCAQYQKARNDELAANCGTRRQWWEGYCHPEISMLLIWQCKPTKFTVEHLV